jgi:dihydropteroate synthase
MPEHILFLTGKLAEKSLRRVLESIRPAEFTYEIRNIGISVAALMTAAMIERRVTAVAGVDRVIVPGLCQGDLDRASAQLGVPVIRGPKDLKDLPVFFGRDCQPADLSRYDVRIFAEIVDAPHMTVPAILERARQYVADGADVIDVGCLPGVDFPHLEESVAALREAGYSVSVDSLEIEELRRGGKAGADYLLSLKESTLWLCEELASIPVLIPEAPGDMASLYRAIEALAGRGREFIADSILDPIHFGFTESLLRYHELRRRHPEIEIMMGIGNLTELTDADTTGINALLFGIISELRIRSVLTTEVSPHARSAVREADRARRLMFAARAMDSLPKDMDDALLTTHARKPFPYTAAEIAELAAEIRDPSYRVIISEDGIHVFNRDGHVQGRDPFALFPKLKLLQDDAPHAFYMGVELAKAQIAWQLGKRYSQDEELDWGAAAVKPAAEEQAEQARAAHALKPENAKPADDYKQAGTTLEASRERRRKRKAS